jgi:hypothetical protein
MSIEVRQPAVQTTCIETAYQLELAVGASHVASMLYPESRNACIKELIVRFAATHGVADLQRFLIALAERLDARANKDGAATVRHFAENGVAPEAVAPKASATARQSRESAKAAV